MVEAHSSEQHSISLSAEHHATHSSHQAWVLADSGTVLRHMVLPFQEVLQPLHGAASRLPRFLSFSQKQQLSEDRYLAPHPSLGQGTGVAGAAGARQASEKVGASERRGRGVVGPGEDVRVCGVDSHVLPCLQQEFKAWLAVRGEDEGLDASTLTLHPDSGEVRKHQALEGGQRGLQWGESWRGTGRDGDRTLGSDASPVFSDGKLGDFTLAPSVVEDQESQAGVAEKAPGLGRLKLPGQGQESRVLQPPQVQHQRGQGGEQRQHVVTP